MKATRHSYRFLRDIPVVLAGFLGVNKSDFLIKNKDSHAIDLELKVPRLRFFIEFRSVASAAQVMKAIHNHRQRLVPAPNIIPLVAVPYMGDAGRSLCIEAEIGWIDLSGNGHIRTEGLFIHVEGHPNRFKTAGRPANVFAPKSARVTRWLLIHPDRPMSRREIARAVDIDEGFVSRIVSRLANEGYIVPLDPDGAGSESGIGLGCGSGSGCGNGDGTGDGSGSSLQRVRSFFVPRDPNLLLRAWAESYRFSAHTILKGHVAARSGEELQAKVADVFSGAKMRYAATGLGAAWLFIHHAVFRLASFYVEEPPESSLLDRIGFREDPDGANLWLAVPNDLGVFHGVDVREGVPCVHPVQAYLDLAEHPERAKEAAELLRERFLSWSGHAP